MLTDILNRTALGRLIVLVVALTAIGAPNQRRRPVPIHCVRGQIARLTAQVASADPRLPEELRRVTRRIASLATALEAELRRFRPLEQRFEQAASHVQDGSGGNLDDELFERLADRFGVLGVRAALQRLHHAHPDAPDNQER